MTPAQFTAAAAERRRVRLIDRSRTFYVDEWYHPVVDDDGALGIETHTGEKIRVDDALLAQLTDEPAMLTVGEVRDQLAQYPDDKPVVLRSGPNAYGGITPESIDQTLLRPQGNPADPSPDPALLENSHDGGDCCNGSDQGHDEPLEHG